MVMLAQGEFRKLLTADTATREGIFRKLFATQKYEMLQDRLGEECRKLERENEKLKSEVLRCAQTVRFAPQDAREEELDERRRSGASMGTWLVDLLEGLVAGDKAESEQLSRQVEELRRKWADANALVKQVENRPRYEQERAALAEEVAQHEGRTEGLQAALQQECAHDAERLEATERAAVIEGTFAKYQALQRADQAVSAAKEALLRSEQACETAQAAAGKAEEQRVQAAQAVEEAKKWFRPELVGRLDELIVFRPLAEDSLCAIAEKLLGQLEARAARNGYQLTHTPRVGAVLAARARSPYGARELRRQVDRAVEQALANQIASGTAHTGQHWTADCTVDGAIVLEEGEAVEQTIG